MAATRICFPHCCINLHECCHSLRSVFAYTHSHSRSCPQCRSLSDAHFLPFDCLSYILFTQPQNATNLFLLLWLEALCIILCDVGVLKMSDMWPYDLRMLRSKHGEGSLCSFLTKWLLWFRAVLEVSSVRSAVVMMLPYVGTLSTTYQSWNKI
jgi:hypothetical protein